MWYSNGLSFIPDKLEVTSFDITQLEMIFQEYILKIKMTHKICGSAHKTSLLI